ncbi:beta-glucuronidase, partial [bacterium]|nr:beta-glucuronidase [bacterium]
MLLRLRFVIPIFLTICMTQSVFAEIPRPEHPFPQMVRSEWLNLNGVWDYAETNDSSDDSYLELDDFPEEITVPFCRESALSGIQRTNFMKNAWYRRAFEVPSNWNNKRVL